MIAIKKNSEFKGREAKSMNYWNTMAELIDNYHANLEMHLSSTL